MFTAGFQSVAQPVELAKPSERFCEITREAPDHIVAQLVGNDRVHRRGVDSIDDLRRCRLGGDAFDRTCFAIVDEDVVHSAIYIYKSYTPVESDRRIFGNVSDILRDETRKQGETPSSLIFYSISNITNAPGVGQYLVRDLHAHLRLTHPFAMASTLSPLRTFDESFTSERKEKFLAMPEADQKRTILSYLLTGQNAVQQFHMGNGARIADIKLNAGDRSFDDKTGAERTHIAMVNYAYDMDAPTLLANAQSFAATKKLIRNTEISEQDRALAVRQSLWPLVSREIIEDIGMDPKTARQMNPGLSM